MSDVAAIIADMVRAGVDAALIGRVAQALSEREAVPVKVVDEQAKRRRAKDRERKRLRNSAESAENAEFPQSPSPLVPPLDKEIPPTPPKEIKSPPIIPPTTGLDSATDWPANAEVVEILIAQSGLRLTNAETWHLRSAGVVALWRHNGFSFRDEVLPTVKAIVDGGAKIKSWAYFTDAIAECRANRLKPIPIPEPRQTHERRNADYRDSSPGRPTDHLTAAIEIDQQRRNAKLAGAG